MTRTRRPAGCLVMASWLTVVTIVFASGQQAQAQPTEPELDCPQGGEVLSGDDVTLQCVTRGLRPARVLLFYRGPGDTEFIAHDMQASSAPDGALLWTLELPGSRIGGAWLPFYVEALDAAGQVIARAAHEQSPALIAVRADLFVDAPPPRARDAVDDADEPLLRKQARQEVTPTTQLEPPLERRWFVGLGVGSGLGYARGPIETHRQYQAAFTPGLAHPGVGQGVLELGLRLNARFALGLLGRAQLARHDRDGDTAWSAFLGLARLAYFPGGAESGLYATLAAGGGEGFRLVVKAQGANGRRVQDTVRGGAFVGGAGVGVVVPIRDAQDGNAYGWVFEAQLLTGLPSLSVALDLNTGLRVGF